MSLSKRSRMCAHGQGRMASAVPFPWWASVSTTRADVEPTFLLEREQGQGNVSVGTEATAPVGAGMVVAAAQS